MTEVNFEMEKTGQARISIFDVSGRLVTTLVNEQLGSGPHSRTWQGKDATGRQVPSGAYYLRMEAGGRVDHRKIMLLKKGYGVQDNNGPASECGRPMSFFGCCTQRQ